MVQELLDAVRAGQAGSLARSLPATELVQQLVREIAEVRAQIANGE